MRPGVVGEGESGAEVALQVFDLLDVFQQLGIYCLLDSFKFVSPFGFSLFALFYLFDSVLGSILELVLGEPPSLLEERIINIQLVKFFKPAM